MIGAGLLLRRALPFALAIGIWLVPVPAGLTAPAWHLFAVFVAAIAAVLVGAYPLLTSTMLAVAAVVLTGTISPAKAFSGFANASVLLVVIAFLVAQAVVKSGLGRRISLFMVSRFGRSSIGLAYSIVLTDAASGVARKRWSDEGIGENDAVGNAEGRVAETTHHEEADALSETRFDDRLGDEEGDHHQQHARVGKTGERLRG